MNLIIEQREITVEQLCAWRNKAIKSLLKSERISRDSKETIMLCNARLRLLRLISLEDKNLIKKNHEKSRIASNF